jgi:hypothetical protein
MRIVDRDGILFVRDSPALHWLLSPVFCVQVVLRDGEVVPVSLLWTHGREAAEAVVTRLRAALGVRAP